LGQATRLVLGRHEQDVGARQEDVLALLRELEERGHPIRDVLRDHLQEVAVVGISLTEEDELRFG
jgi:hypothetical protein